MSSSLWVAKSNFCRENSNLVSLAPASAAGSSLLYLAMKDLLFLLAHLLTALAKLLGPAAHERSSPTASS